jgi:outer membrane receptor protein involved in Fe transport
MRVAVAVAIVFASFVGITSADEARASIRQPTQIGAQELAPALRMLAKERNVQFVYRSDLVENQHTGGAAGDLTFEEALAQLLKGTGLTYRFLEANAITIVPAEEPVGINQSPHGSPGAAAQFAEAPVRLEEVVVTATKRAEKLSDVPLAVQALTADELQKQGARTFDDYARSVAGLQYVSTGAGRDQIFMRGIAAPQGYIGMQSAIGVYLDDVPISEGLNQPDLNLYDIDRVEVLRGPQGTLYGSASMGGTIKLVTNKPDTHRLSAFADADVSYTEHGSANGQYNAVFNLPVATDLAAIRGVFYGRNPSGYLSNPLLDHSHVNDENTYGGRLAVRLTPRDDLTIDLTGMYQRTDQGAYNRVDSVNGDVNALTQYRHFDEHFRDKSTVMNAAVQYHGSSFDLVSSSSYNRRTRAEGDDFTGLDLFGDLALTPSLQIYHTRSFTQEFRANSARPGWIGWLAGAYFSNVRNDFFQSVDSSDGIALFGLPTDNVAILQQSATTRELAGFGEASIRPFAAFTITAGLRYDTVKLDANSARSGLIFGGLLADEANTSQHEVIPKLNLSYKLQDALVYAQASKGFRIGGLNVTFQPTGDGFVFPRAYAPDSLWNYELGWKASMLNGALSVDADAFLINWKNIQLDLQHAGYDYLTNAGDARSKGVELQVTARPARSWSLGGQLTYTDSHLTTTTPGVGTQGDRVPFVPRISASGFVEYHAALGRLGAGLARLDVQRVGTAYTGFGSANNFVYGGYTITNVRVGTDIDGSDIALYAKNLFDERARLFADPYQGGYPGVDPVAYTIVRPRTVGIEVSHKF